MKRSLTMRLMLLFSLLLAAFTVLTAVIYNALMVRQSITHHSQAMQRDAFAIAQNLSELVAPSAYDASLDETRFIVSEENLPPYLALTEQLTRCNVYLVDSHHNVTGYFDGVVQVLERPLLAGYLEQSIALGFMGKTPIIHAEMDGETRLCASMPVMDAQSRVLGVVLLDATLRELGFQQVPSAAILISSGLIAFVLSAVLALVFSRLFTRPIVRVEKVAVALASGHPVQPLHARRRDEVGSLARSMDVLAQRLEEARRRDEQHRLAQQRLFSGISHELKTPVTVIRGSLEALRDGVVTGPEAVSAYYAQMIGETRWLQHLIRDLLELSRLQSDDFALDLSPVDLSELLSDVAMSARAPVHPKGPDLCLRGAVRPSPGHGRLFPPAPDAHDRRGQRREIHAAGAGRAPVAGRGAALRLRGRRGPRHSRRGGAADLRALPPHPRPLARGRGPGPGHRGGDRPAARGDHLGCQRRGPGDRLYLRLSIKRSINKAGGRLFRAAA